MDERTEALERLYRLRYATFRDVLSGLIGSRETAREVVQEAFAVALRERRKLRDVGAVEPWVWRIAFRLAVKPRREGRLLAAEVPDSAASDVLVDHDVRAALLRLPPRRRLILFLRYYADLSHAEIGSACGIEEGTVAATLAKARAELQALLTEEVTA